MKAQLLSLYSFMPSIQVIEELDWLGMLSRSDVFYNGVYEACFLANNVNKKVDEVISFYLGKSQLPMVWYLTSACKPKDLSNVLKAKGFKFAYKTPGMYLYLENYKQHRKLDSPHKVIQVSNVGQLSQWMRPGEESFNISDTITKAYFELFKIKGFQPQTPWRLLLGTIDGRPVTSARLFFNNDVAGIFHVATIPSARHKGYGTEITIAALETAKNLGCKLAILESSPAGYNVYYRLGFRDCCFCDTYIGPQ